VRLRRRWCGTRRPSSRQSRCTFLWFTAHPSARASQNALRTRDVDTPEPTPAARYARPRPGPPASSTAEGVVGWTDADRSPGRRTARTPPTSASDGAPQPGVAPGSEVSPGDLLQRGLFHRRVGQQPLQRGVLPLEVFNRLASSAFKPPNWLRHRWYVGSDTPNPRHTAATSLPSASSRSADVSFRTTVARGTRGCLAISPELPRLHVVGANCARPGVTSRGRPTGRPRAALAAAVPARIRSLITSRSIMWTTPIPSGVVEHPAEYCSSSPDQRIVQRE